MAEYKDRFEKWQKQAKDKFEQLDEQLGLSETLEEGVKIARETATKGAESLKEGVGKIKSEAEKSPLGKRAVEIAEDTIETAEKTAKQAWVASEPVREAAEEAGDAAGGVFDTATKNAGDVAKTAGVKAGEVINTAGKKAGEVLGETRKGVESTAQSFANAFGFGVSWTRTIDSAFKTLSTTGAWIQDKPLQAAATGASVAVGTGLGVVFTGLSSHWFFNSAIPAATVKFAATKFDEHLKDQQKLVEKGNLSKAETERLKWEREITKYVGAPLLGAFSFASGAVMMTNIINPKTITGAPLDWLLRGNPLLEGVWFFGNGMVCFKTGYDFFMISLDDHEDVQRIVREVKGMLPAAKTSPNTA